LTPGLEQADLLIMKHPIIFIAIAATVPLSTLIPLCSARVVTPVLPSGGAVAPILSKDAPQVRTRDLNPFNRRGLLEGDVDGNATILAGPAPITDEFWQKMVSKGCNILQACAASDKDAAEWVGRTSSAESPFQSFLGRCLSGSPR
jgi:hypothetical protein